MQYENRSLTGEAPKDQSEDVWSAAARYPGAAMCRLAQTLGGLASLVAQGDHRIDLHGAASRDVASQNGHTEQESGNAKESRGIYGTNAI